MGCNWGALVGADMTDYVIILNTTEAVTAFSGVGHATVGAALEMAIGPLGRSAEGVACMTDKVIAPCVSYAHSKGLYAGVCLEGAVVVCRPDVNFNFYGRTIEPKEILSGSVLPPRAAQPLYDALAHYAGAGPAVIPSFAGHSGAGGGTSSLASMGSMVDAAPVAKAATQAAFGGMLA